MIYYKRISQYTDFIYSYNCNMYLNGKKTYTLLFRKDYIHLSQYRNMHHLQLDPQLDPHSYLLVLSPLRVHYDPYEVIIEYVSLLYRY